MRHLLVLTLAVFSPAAFAGSLECNGANLSYLRATPDGGVFSPTIEKLVLNGKTLIQMDWRQHQNIRLASFQLSGPQTVIKKENLPGFYVATTFEGGATVTMNGDSQPLFSASVACVEKRYVGIPHP